MAITEIKILEGCTLCGLCESICPDIFRLGDEKSMIVDGADFEANHDCIQEAASMCPVEVIKIS